MILYFDVYIVSKTTFEDPVKNKNFDINVKSSSIYRYNNYNYKFKSKLDITKYTLASYSIIDWTAVIIKFQCEDIRDENNFTNFCKEYFPKAIIENYRSDTAEKFKKSLQRLKKFGNPWVWFCPNNDHPFLSDPRKLKN